MTQSFFPPGILREKASLLNAVLRAVDWAIIVLVGWGAYWVYHGIPYLPVQYTVALTLAVLAAALVFPRFGIYRAWRGRFLLDELQVIGLAWGTVVVILVLFAFATKSSEDFSRMWTGLWFILGFLGLVASRVLLRTLLASLRARGFNTKFVVLVGNHKLAGQVAESLESAPWAGLEVKGCFLDREEAAGAPANPLPILGTYDDLPDYLEHERIDEVWLTQSLGGESRVNEVFRQVGNQAVDVRYVPDLFDLKLLNKSVTEIAGMPVINLNLSPMDGINRVVKAIEDYTLAALILVLASPLLALIAIAVKLDSPGPVLFRQKRHGWGGREISVYKFRTMVEHGEEPGQVTQARRDDARLTRVGRLLRRVSLDELPQLFNVLRGHMSLVGPRPHAVAHNLRYRRELDGYMMRHKVKPGITGWAQVNGYRGETDTLEKMEKRVQYDQYYIENWSLWLDLKIIALTLVRLWTDKNAY